MCGVWGSGANHGSAARFDTGSRLWSLNSMVEASRNVMAHAQKTDFFFWRNGRVHLNRPFRCQFSRLLAAKVCASAVVMLDTPYSDLVWRVLATHSIHQFPLHFPSRASMCAITFQLESSNGNSYTVCRHKEIVKWWGGEIVGMLGVGGGWNWFKMDNNDRRNGS